jgi:tetratricopeptide (TPR) repeat protein
MFSGINKIINDKISSGDYKSAEEICNAELNIGTANAQILFFVGIIFLLTNRYSAAIGVFSKLAETSGDVPDVWNNLAQAYSYSGKPFEASACLENALTGCKKTLDEIKKSRFKHSVLFGAL